jgi:hypothetical protein
MRDCVEFLKWLNIRDNNRCNDLITSIDESMYLDYSSYTWWIDSGATIHAVNFLQGLNMRRILPSNDFTLYLHDVLYVPSMRRNLISVSCLDDNRFDCLFGKK